MAKLFTGNCPKNVSKDAKYGVRTHDGSWRVGLFYYAGAGERWNLSTAAHQPLVDMVNAVKQEVNLAPNGSFYINEFRQVIVPAMDRKYYYAGEYDSPIEFEFEGQRISGRADRLNPGDPWEGPHPGIPYVLEASGNDIRYEVEPRPNVTRKVRLSDTVGKAVAQEVANQLRTIKGWGGGRFYVNEFGTMFAPLNDDGLRYVYAGNIDLERWFPPVAH